jgi:RES domain-containing protein
MPTLYRIAKRRHPVYDGGGAFAQGARWTSPGRLVIYAAEHYGTALLEQLVRAELGELPGPHHAAAIVVPDDVAAERFDPTGTPGWDAERSPAARGFGDAWHSRGQTALLYVPSVPGQPVEWNVLINPQHPDAARIRVAPAFPVAWDGRLVRLRLERP